MAIEARRMTQGSELEGIRTWRKPIGPTGRGSRRRNRSRLMTDFAVVVVLRFLVGKRDRTAKGSAYELWLRLESLFPEQPRDYVLMLVVWKLDQKLALTDWVAKSKTRLVSWRDFRVTVRTYRWLGAPEELGAVTADTCVVTRKIGNVRIVSNLFPIIGWNLVAGIASRLMLPGRM